MGRLARLARSGRFNQLESEWLEALESDSPDFDGMLEAAGYLARKGGAEQAAVLLWAMLGALPEPLDPQDKLQLFRQAAAMVPQDRTLREHLPPILRAAFPKHVGLDSILEAIPRGLTSDEAVSLAELSLSLAPGSYLEDPSGTVVRVEGYVAPRCVFVMRSADGTREVPIAQLSGYKTLSSHNLRALFTFERNRLDALRAEHPAGLIAVIVRGMGGSANWRQVRARVLEEELLTARSWGSWWASAKRDMEATGLLELTPDGDIVLRQTPLSPAEVVERALAKAGGLPRKAVVLLDEISRLKSRLADESSHLQQILAALSERADAAREDVWGSFLLNVAVAKAAETLGIDAAQPPPNSLPPVPSDPLLEVPEKLLEHALTLAQEISPDRWPDWWLALWPKLPVRLAERTAQLLAERGLGSQLSELLSDVATRPDAHPHAFVWLWRACTSPQPRYGGPLPPIPPLTLTFSLLALAERIARPQPAAHAELRKQFLGRLRAVLRSDNYAGFRRLVGEADEPSLRRLRSTVSSSRALGTALKEALLEIIRARPVAPEVPPWERKDVIWATEGSLEHRREELDHLLRVEIPANSRAIGEAASRGDLSENAEWAAALDQQKLLASRAAQIQRELAKARIITNEQIPDDKVGVGCTVTVEETATGAEHVFTFLGPWDANPDKGVYSYKAPFSGRFLGKKVGDTVEPPGRGGTTYRIREIAPAPVLVEKTPAHTSTKGQGE